MDPIESNAAPSTPDLTTTAGPTTSATTTAATTAGKTTGMALSTKIIIVLTAVIVLGGAGGIAMYSNLASNEPETPKIGYAEGVTVIDERDMADIDLTPPDAMTLEYSNNAFSADGKSFECYIANAIENEFDMYINIFSDASLSDQLYLSELLRPGTGFEQITLDKALDPGLHTVYVVFTQVENGGESIHAQVVVTIDFSVEE